MLVGENLARLPQFELSLLDPSIGRSNLPGNSVGPLTQFCAPRALNVELPGRPLDVAFKLINPVTDRSQHRIQHVDSLQVGRAPDGSRRAGAFVCVRASVARTSPRTYTPSIAHNPSVTGHSVTVKHLF